MAPLLILRIGSTLIYSSTDPNYVAEATETAVAKATDELKAGVDMLTISERPDNNSALFEMRRCRLQGELQQYQLNDRAQRHEYEWRWAVNPELNGTQRASVVMVKRFLG